MVNLNTAIEAIGRNENKTSKKYQFISTKQVIGVFINAGFEVVKVYGGKNPYSFHSVTFRQAGQDKLNVGDSEFRIYLTNAHDGSSSFTLTAGLFRLVCSNGLAVGTSTIQNERIRHIGYANSEVEAAINSVVKQFPFISECVSRMRETTLTNEECEFFAKQAAALRTNAGVSVDLAALLQVARTEDAGNSLWCVFNRIQERLMLGGVSTYNAQTGRRGGMRRLTSEKRRLKLNQDLWNLAVSLIK